MLRYFIPGFAFFLSAAFVLLPTAIESAEADPAAQSLTAATVIAAPPDLVQAPAPAQPEILARWQAGAGVATTAPSGITQPEPDAIYERQDVEIGPVPAEFTFAAPAAGRLVTAAHSRFSFHREGEQLVVELLFGIVEVRLDDRGSYAGVTVRGARSEVHVTGTLFVVERTQGNVDFIGVISGKVEVSLRQKVGEELSEDRRTVELGLRQGLAVGAGPLGQPVALASRPLVASLRAGTGLQSAVAVSSSTADSNGGSWTNESQLGVDPGLRIRASLDGNALARDQVRERLRDETITQVLDGGRNILPPVLPAPPMPPP